MCNIPVEAPVCPNTISEQAGRKDPNPRWLLASSSATRDWNDESASRECSKGEQCHAGGWWGCRMTPRHWADRRVLTLVCSWGAFHRQLRVAAPSLCSMHCKAAPTAPPAPTSSTVFPPARHKASCSAALGCTGTSIRLHRAAELERLRELPPPLPGHPLPKPSRRASKAAHDRPAPCACTTTAAVALGATLSEPMQ